jgi:glycosyltransferase involved in cell wall biosynthesis
VKLVRAEKPDIVFSAMLHLSLWTIIFRFMMPRSTKFIARESTTVSAYYVSKVTQWTVKKFYPWFDKIICQSDYMKNDLVLNFHVDPNKMMVINNPVDSNRILKLAETGDKNTHDGYKIVTVGRLIYLKGYDILLDAISILLKAGEDVTLMIVGDGPLLNNLTDQAKHLGISHKVKFVGFNANPYGIVSTSDLFVLSSRFEGFPNVVLESHVCGTPVVALKGPGGIEEIMIDNENGWLVRTSDAASLASTISLAKRNPLDKMRIRESALRRYDLKKIIPQYESALEYLK